MIAPDVAVPRIGRVDGGVAFVCPTVTTLHHDTIVWCGGMAAPVQPCPETTIVSISRGGR